MKFMITWQFHQGKLHEGYSQFFKMTPEQDAADRGSRIKQIGRWHDLARGRGVVICESESTEAVANWALMIWPRKRVQAVAQFWLLLDKCKGLVTLNWFLLFLDILACF